MKYAVWFIASLFFFFDSLAQQAFDGKWSGTLKVQSMELGLIFDIKKEESGYSATMDSPDQGAKGITVDKVEIKGDSIYLTISAIGVQYNGKKIDDAIIDGTFAQRGFTTEMTLKRGGLLVAAKPQDPIKPYPYKEEQVNFTNPKTGKKLSGTLTLPNAKSSVPAIVLVSGSGPQDRDETLLGHKPFLVLSDYFTRNGYAVLRYDDRGVGESEGVFETATTADFADDAQAALQFLSGRKEINKKKIGVMGHSEGAQIAGTLAANTKEPKFIVMLAGPGVDGKEILLQQQEAIAKGAGVEDSLIQKSLKANRTVFEVMQSTKDMAQIRERLKLYLVNAFKDGTLQGSEGMSVNAAVDAYMNDLMNIWIIRFVQYDPQPDLKKIKIPTLALIGSKDQQVLAKYNIPALQNAFAASGNKKATVKEIEGLNHLFQTATTGMPEEYASIQETFSPKAMQLILDWLNANVK